MLNKRQILSLVFEREKLSYASNEKDLCEQSKDQQSVVSFLLADNNVLPKMLLMKTSGEFKFQKSYTATPHSGPTA